MKTTSEFLEKIACGWAVLTDLFVVHANGVSIAVSSCPKIGSLYDALR